MRQERVHVHRRSATEDVDRGVAVLGPGVDRNMGFRDRRDAGDTLRSEFVHHDFDDGRAGELETFLEHLLDFREIVEIRERATGEVDETVFA